MSWQEFEPMLRERLTQRIESEPEVLLERDGGPEGLRADIILATLYGFDEQVDEEWRIPDVPSRLFRALPDRQTYSLAEPPSISPNIPQATYKLQSTYAWMDLDWLAHRHLLPADVRPAPATNLVSAALVRYRRRS
jgi:hypothetical protein